MKLCLIIKFSRSRISKSFSKMKHFFGSTKCSNACARKLFCAFIKSCFILNFDQELLIDCAMLHFVVALMLSFASFYLRLKIVIDSF